MSSLFGQSEMQSNPNWTSWYNPYIKDPIQSSGQGFRPLFEVGLVPSGADSGSGDISHKRSDLTMRPPEDALKPRSSDRHLRTGGALAALKSQEMLFAGGLSPVANDFPIQHSQRSYLSLRAETAVGVGALDGAYDSTLHKTELRKAALYSNVGLPQLLTSNAPMPRSPTPPSAAIPRRPGRIIGSSFSNQHAAYRDFGKEVREQQPQVVMPDRMRWIYRDLQGNHQGPWSGLEMHDWFKAGFFPPEMLIKKVEDTDFEPLVQLVRRIGNSREPFLVPHFSVPKARESSSPLAPKGPLYPQKALKPLPVLPAHAEEVAASSAQSQGSSSAYPDVTVARLQDFGKKRFVVGDSIRNIDFPLSRPEAGLLCHRPSTPPSIAPASPEPPNDGPSHSPAHSVSQAGGPSPFRRPSPPLSSVIRQSPFQRPPNPPPRPRHASPPAHPSLTQFYQPAPPLIQQASEIEQQIIHLRRNLASQNTRRISIQCRATLLRIQGQLDLLMADIEDIDWRPKVERDKSRELELDVLDEEDPEDDPDGALREEKWKQRIRLDEELGRRTF